MEEFIIKSISIVLCGSVVLLKVADLARLSSEVVHNKYEEDVPSYHYLSASLFGIGVDMVVIGLMYAGDIVEKIMDSRLMDWFKGTIQPLQIQPNGVYFDFKFGEWAGHDTPKEKPGKYEMDI